MIRDELETILQTIFDDQNLQLRDDMGPGCFEPWDSIETVQIVMSVEQTFNVRLTMDEVAELKSVAYLIDLLKQKTGMNE